MKLVATLLIPRGVPGESEQWYRFDVPFELGESVLDGLRRIRASTDPSLAFRFSCINANACKECMILLDGTTVYACTARLEAREMRLEPLRNKGLIRDLAVEIAPPDERITFIERTQPKLS
jgi:succinate dehydrogenase/fumarate reductase-like Fe-S protein